MRLEELAERVYVAAHRRFRFDLQDVKVHVNPEEHREVVFEVETEVGGPAVFGADHLFGMPVVADPSIPRGKIVLRVEVEA